MRLYKNAVLRLDQRHDLKGCYATIDVDGHGAIAEVVVRMEDQTDDSPELVAFAGRLVACYNLLDGYDTKAFEGMTLAEFVAKQAYLSEMTTVDGLSITLSGLAMQMVAASFAGQFKANGASNYLEISASHPDTGPFTITMQRKEGVTPIMKLEDMTKQLDDAASKLNTAISTIYEVERVISELVKNGNGSIEPDDLLGEVNYCIGRMLAAAAPKPEASK